MSEKQITDFWNKYKVGTRGMFITVWFIFVCMSIAIFNEIKIDTHFQDIISNLVMYITIFVAVGANGIEKIADTYAKIKIDNKKEDINVY